MATELINRLQNINAELRRDKDTVDILLVVIVSIIIVLYCSLFINALLNKPKDVAFTESQIIEIYYKAIPNNQGENFCYRLESNYVFCSDEAYNKGTVIEVKQNGTRSVK